MAQDKMAKVPEAVQATEEYKAFKVEQRGIDLIPDADRKMRPSGLFWLWSGAVFNVEFFFYGTLVMFFGLSVPQAVAVILIGNLFYVVLGLASLQGPLTGTTAFMVSRAPFGKNANRLVAVFNWVTQVGFEVEGVYFIVATVILLFLHYGTTLNTLAKVVVIILAAGVQLLMPLFGHATITKLFRYLAYLFILLFLLLGVFVVGKLHTAHFPHTSASAPVWTTALVLVISLGGLGWSENGNDYSRYLPRSTPRSQTFWAATLGPAIPTVLLELLGVFAFTITTQTVGITQLGVPNVLPNWFYVPFLIFGIIQIFTVNTLNLYSSGVTLQAIGIPIPRWGAVIVDTVVGATVTAIIIFSSSKFYADFAGFLLYIVVWLAPWFAILLVDYLLRRGRYDPASLVRRHGGLYWRNNGVHWPAVIALIAGMVATLLWINAATAFPSYTGPISAHFPGLHGGDLSWLLGVIVAGGLYWLLARNGVAREVEQTPEPPRVTTQV
jgi:purine-cytosine permease-like protein